MEPKDDYSARFFLDTKIVIINRRIQCFLVNYYEEE